ncbi:MAG: hypothetical protein K9H16_01060 [Bacteroidales bacterium]|nr:hypothetical protein [Bacteroidales bacterium]
MAREGKITYCLQLDEKGYFGLEEQSECAILIFDDDLKLLQKLDLTYSIDEKLKKLEPISFFKANTGFVLLCRNWSPHNLTVNAYLFKIDSSGLIVELLNPGTIENISKSDAGFDFFALHKIHYDTTNQYVFTIKTPSFQEVSERIVLNIYDENLTLTGNRLLDYPDDFMDYNFSGLISSGNGLFFIHVENSNPFEVNDVVHQIVVYDMNSDNFETFTLSFKNRMPKKVALFHIEKDIIALMGYFAKDRFDDEPMGIFYHLFDAKTGDLLVENIYDFSDEEKAFLEPGKYSSTATYENLMPAAVHITSHNHVLLLFEYNWKRIMLIRDQKGMLYDKPYFYANEVFIFQFDAANQRNHFAIIPKKQALGYDREILGFTSFITESNLFVLYNDNPKNRNITNEGKLKTMKGKYEMMIAEYNLLSGDFGKKVFSDPNNQFVLNPSDVFHADDSTLLFIDRSENPALVKIKIR